MWAIGSQGPGFFPNSSRRFLTNTLYLSFRTKAPQSKIIIRTSFLEKQIMWPTQLSTRNLARVEINAVYFNSHFEN